MIIDKNGNPLRFDHLDIATEEEVDQLTRQRGLVLESEVSQIESCSVPWPYFNRHWEYDDQ